MYIKALPVENLLLQVFFNLMFSKRDSLIYVLYKFLGILASILPTLLNSAVACDSTSKASSES